MATGIEMMLKAMGLDPVAMRGVLENTVANINALSADLKQINQRLERIEKVLDIPSEAAEVRKIANG